MVPSDSSRGRKRADTPRAIEDCHGRLARMPGCPVILPGATVIGSSW